MVYDLQLFSKAELWPVCVPPIRTPVQWCQEGGAQEGGEVMGGARDGICVLRGRGGHPECAGCLPSEDTGRGCRPDLQTSRTLVLAARTVRKNEKKQSYFTAA